MARMLLRAPGLRSATSTHPATTVQPWAWLMDTQAGCHSMARMLPRRRMSGRTIRPIGIRILASSNLDSGTSSGTIHGKDEVDCLVRPGGLLSPTYYYQRTGQRRESSATAGCDDYFPDACGV